MFQDNWDDEDVEKPGKWNSFDLISRINVLLSNKQNKKQVILEIDNFCDKTGIF